MTTYQWLLVGHLAAVFALVGGYAGATVCGLLLPRTERASAALLLARAAGRCERLLVYPAALAALGLGVAMVERSDGQYGLSQTWVRVSLFLWVVLTALTSVTGRHARVVVEHAAPLGDRFASDELQAAVRNRTAQGVRYGNGVVLLALMLLMVWKPGVG